MRVGVAGRQAEGTTLYRVRTICFDVHTYIQYMIISREAST